MIQLFILGTAAILAFKLVGEWTWYFTAKIFSGWAVLVFTIWFYKNKIFKR